MDNGKTRESAAVCSASGSANSAHWHLKFKLVYSSKYNGGLAAFWSRLETLNKVLSGLLGISVVSTILLSFGTHWSIGFAGVVAVFNIIDLAVGFSNKSNTFREQKRAYDLILADFKRLGNNATSEEVAALESRCADVEISVVEDLNAYSEVCYNDVSRSFGCDKRYLVDVPWYKYWTRYFISWPKGMQFKDLQV